MSGDKPATSTMPWSSLLGTIREYAIFTLDTEGVIDSWNLGVRELLGYEEHEFVGQRGRIIFTLEDREDGAVDAELEQARATGEAMDDRWHVRKDGSRFWANGIMHAVRDENGELTGYLKLMRDQTEKLASDARLEQQRTLITAILDSLPGIFYVLDGQHLVRWNDEFERVTGLSAEELAQATAEDLIVEAALARESLQFVLSGGQRSFEGHIRGKGGVEIPYLFTGHRVILGDRPLLLGVGIDNRHQVRARELLERRALEQTTVAELAATTLSSHDVAEMFALAVRRVGETMGTGEVRIVEPEGQVTEGALSAPIQGYGRSLGTIEVRARPGVDFSLEDANFVEAVANLLAGAAEQQRLHAELEREAETDDLTGLLNRVAFEHRLTAELGRAERQGTKVAVMFIDLDRFKTVNDSFGHLAGDEVLKEAATRILDSVRSWDSVARHGGDEFVLFLPGINVNDEVTTVAERLLDALSAPLAVNGQEVRLGGTVGIAFYPDDGQEAKSLLQAADAALYRGKAAGRRQFHFFAREA